MELTNEQSRRIEFHNILKTIVPNVYFDPPENVKLQYPCIIYSVNNKDTVYGDNLPYVISKAYKVMVLTLDSEDPIVEKVEQLKTSMWQTGYWSGTIRHDVFRIFY